MRKVLIALLALFGVFCVLAVVVVMGVGLLSVATSDRMPRRVIVEMNFERGVAEVLPDDPIARLTQDPLPEVRDVVDAFRRAADDRRVVGVFARVGGAGIGLAHLQEIRDAVARFRESGKPSIAFATSFGEFGPGNGSYYLASAFERVYLQPSGNLGLTGLIYESPFVRGLLDKLEVRPLIGQRYEYKNAVNFYTERAFTEPHERAMQELMDSQFAQIVRGVGASRGLEESRVRELFDQGPFLGGAAIDAGLVDELGYRDEALAALREAASADAETIGISAYLRHAGRPNRRGETIALIHGAGAVMPGRSGYSPVDGSQTMGAETLGEAFRAAVDDRRVRAILFRVDSPGGSFVASDAIWRETVRAREAGKPVVVSMGNLAGSGGYYVAMDADKIVAEPGTITASIGVYGGKLYTRDFWQKLGVTWDDVRTSAHSRMWSAHYDWSEGGRSFDAMLDRVYDVFTTKVAEARGLPLERVREIAGGRIWTGEDARVLGLVDELGGIDVALRLAREAAGLAADEPVRLKVFPRPRSIWEMVFRRAEADSAALGSAAQMMRTMRPALAALARLGLAGDDGVLTMPDVPPALQ